MFAMQGQPKEFVPQSLTRINQQVSIRTEESAAPKEGDSPINQHEMVIETRFGKIGVSLDNAIFFPQGLLGLSENLHFVITDIPQKTNMGQFKLLQCLNDHSLSFVVLPLDIDNTVIERTDLEECCNLLNVPADNLLTLLIVSVNRTPEDTKVTANIRAPIIVDVEDKAGIQYVFPHAKYDISHTLGG